MHSPATLALGTGRGPQRCGALRLRPRLHPAMLLLTLAALGTLLAGGAGAQPPASYGSYSEFPTGPSPRGVVVADFDRDARPDLAIANYNSNTLSVLLGNGAGGFGPKTDFTTGTNPLVAATADLDADGDPDVVVTNVYGASVSVLLGDGAGGFLSTTDVAVGTWPWYIAVGDVNEDGRPDLAVVNEGDHSVSVLLGDGAGGFPTRLDLATAYDPTWVGIGDMDGDGHADVVTTSWWGYAVSVHPGDGAGAFAPRIDTALANQAYSAALGDVNGDGDLDLAISCHDADLVTVLLGRGDGTFDPESAFGTGDFPTAVKIGDLNGDGRPDLAVSSFNSATASILLGDGAGGFGPKTDFELGGAAQWATIGDVDRDGRLDLVATRLYNDKVSILLNTTSGSTITPQPPATCVTPSHPCVTVPVTIDRTDATPIRGFSVTLQLLANLALCDSQIVEGPYLRSVGGTYFDVIDNGGGSYTVDGAILGVPCGATAAGGTLFTVKVGSGAPGGAGAVTVAGVTVRDCDNATLAAFPGPPAALPIDNQTPAAVALAAAQQKTGNDADGTTRIQLSWTGAVAAGDSVLLYRAPYGSYPEYDMGGAVPATPAYPPAAPWMHAGTVVAPVATFTDEPDTRDFWFYVAFVEDPCGSVGPASNRTGGTLAYHLGDVSDGTTACQGDNLVGTADVSLLGTNYGSALADPDARGCLDVGPTADHSVDARPLPDDRLDFEDLMLFAINYGEVSAPSPPPADERAVAGRDELALDAPAAVAAGQSFAVAVRLAGAGDVQGLSVQLGWDPAVVRPLRVESGDLVAAHNGVVLSAGPGNVDAALLGTGRGFAGEGVLATVLFQALAAGDPRIVVRSAAARDGANREVALGVPAARSTPEETRLLPAGPNPFAGVTVLAFALARGGPVELSIYSVSGRRVRTLVSGTREAGVHRLVWDGTDDGGQRAGPGVYFVRLGTSAGQCRETLISLE